MFGTQYANPAQDILNEIHDANVPHLFTPQTVRARKLALQESKSKLNTAQQHLNQQQDKIREQFGGKKKPKEQAEEEKLALAPFTLLEELIQTLRQKVAELEKAMDTGKMIPTGFEFGDRIFGDDESGEWFLGDDYDSERWDETITIKRRLDDYMQQRKPFVERLQMLETEKNELKTRVVEAREAVKKGEKGGATRGKTMIIGLLAVLMIALGAFLYFLQENMIGLALVGMALAFLLYIPIMKRNHRRKIANYRQDIEAWIHEGKSLQRKIKEVKLEADPVNRACKSLSVQYKDLRASFD